MYTVEQVCALYGVDVLRMQSRVITVQGVANRARPMFFGRWKDKLGVEHFGGMADLLLRPRLPFCYIVPGVHTVTSLAHDCQKVTVPLWIECKSGADKLSFEQLAFKKHVEENGEFWICVHDDVRPLIEWFESRGVRK